jgi:hypothetical protein
MSSHNNVTRTQHTLWPHLLIDPLHKHSQEEDWGDRRGQVAGHWLDVVKQLTALGRLDHRDPADTDGYDDEDPHSERERRSQWEADILLEHTLYWPTPANGLGQLNFST